MPKIRKGKINEAGMVRRVQEATGLPKQDAKNAVKTVYEIIRQTLVEGGEIGFPNFGTLRTIWLKPRVSKVDFGSDGESKKRGHRRKIVFGITRAMSADIRHEHFSDDPDHNPRMIPYEELPPKMEDEDAGQ